MKETGRLQAKIIRKYVDMRLKRVSKTQWLTETQQMIDMLRKTEHADCIPELFQVQLWLTKGETEGVEALMDTIADWLRGHSEQFPICHAYYLYLTALRKQDTAYDKRVTQKLKELIQKNPSVWEIDWLLFYADNTMEEPSEQYQFLKKMYLKGCRSPLMYLEARALLERNPAFLCEFSEFELQTAVFMVRYAGMSSRVREILEEDMLQRKDYRYIYLVLLWGCYDIMPSKRLLEGISRIMILGSCAGESFSKWYRKAIQEGVHLKGLCEAYMRSLPIEQWYFDGEELSDARRIPTEVLEYFAHDCSLDPVRMAYLYALVHKCRQEQPSIYEAYEPLLLPFIMDNLHAGRVNAGLAYLYENVLSVTDIPKKYTEQFLDICHTCRVTGLLAESGVLRVCYDHADIMTQTAICRGEAVVVLYGGAYHFLVQNADGILLDTPEVKVIPMMTQQSCETFLEAHTAENRLYHMSLVEQAMQKQDIQACDASVKYIWTEERIHTAWKEEAAAFVFPYWDANGRQEEILQAAPYVFVNAGGYDGHKETLFWKEQYLDNKIGTYGVQFLMQHYEGSLQELAGLFMKGKALDVQNSRFAERLLSGMEETGQLLPQYAEILEVYCMESTEQQRVQKFLEFAAKESYKSSSKMPWSMLKKQAELTQAGCVFSISAMLAFLYSITQAGLGNSTQECTQTAAGYIRALLEKDIYFSWLAPLKGICPELEEKEAFTVLEYKGEGQEPVWVRYAKYTASTEEPDSFESEVMDKVCDGIYTKSFILFFGERLRYEILMLEGTQQTLLKQGILQRGQDAQKIGTSRFACIDHMLFLREKREDKQLHEELEAYYRQNALIEQLYTLR